jgi:putative ABC transport system permease protein
MDTKSLFLASILILIPIYISYREKLGLQKDILVSVFRAVVQLALIGYVLEFIFGLSNPIFTVGLVIVMIFNASLNTKSRGDAIKKVVRISFVSMTITTAITMTVLILSGAIDFVPNQVIPVAGMVVSSAMVAIGLGYSSLNSSFRIRRAEVEVKLSLGSGIKEASREILRDSVKLAILPSIDSAKTLGIVSLPGMMTGLILAGVSPLVAIKFQVMVTFMILSSSSLATLMAVYLSYPSFFNERKQLKS